MALILVVEDDPAQREAMSVVLQRAGHDVITAADGELGLEAALAIEPDLVTADVLMPGLNGLQLIAALQTSADLAGIPVLLISAGDERAQMRTGMHAGADDYLTKPFTPAELLDSVRTLLHKKGVRERQARRATEKWVRDALSEQREQLADSYELRLQQELQSRWERARERADEIHEDSCVLAACLFATFPPPASTDIEREAIREIQLRFRDVLMLFDAQRVVFQGAHVVAVFHDDAGDAGSAPVRCQRAAQALARGMPDMPLALSAGAVQLVHAADALHGAQDEVIACGPAVTEALARLLQGEAAAPAAPRATAGFQRRLEVAQAHLAETQVQTLEPVGGTEDAQAHAHRGTMPVHDRDSFLARYSASPALAGVVWKVFSHHGPRLMGELERVVREGNASEVSRLAHSLKGNAAMVSAPRLVESAKALEQLSADQPYALDRIASHFEQVFADFCELKAVPGPHA